MARTRIQSVTTKTTRPHSLLKNDPLDNSDHHHNAAPEKTSFKSNVLKTLKKFFSFSSGSKILPSSVAQDDDPVFHRSKSMDNDTSDPWSPMSPGSAASRSSSFMGFEDSFTPQAQVIIDFEEDPNSDGFRMPTVIDETDFSELEQAPTLPPKPLLPSQVLDQALIALDLEQAKEELPEEEKVITVVQEHRPEAVATIAVQPLTIQTISDGLQRIDLSLKSIKSAIEEIDARRKESWAALDKMFEDAKSQMAKSFARAKETSRKQHEEFLEKLEELDKSFSNLDDDNSSIHSMGEGPADTSL